MVSLGSTSIPTSWERNLATSAGANVKVVRGRLGQATASTTLYRDGHLLNDDLSGVADALGKAITSTAVSGASECQRTAFNTC
jgi:hypothetical protein